MDKEYSKQNNIIWNLAVRDDNFVAKQISKNKQIDGIYSLKEAGLLDEFFQFLTEAGMIELIKGVKYKNVKREMVEFYRYIFLYIFKSIMGIRSMNSLPNLLFSNTAAMGLVGFNAYQVKNGICNRGDFKRKKKEKSGPICPWTVSNNIVKIPANEVENLLNQAISKIAQMLLLPKAINTILDTTDLETTEKFKGCGSVTREKKIKDKNGKEQEVEITVYGFKLLVLYCFSNKIPIAAKLIKINESGSDYTGAIMEQAKKNLGENCKIKCVAMDKEFLDGEELWKLNEKGIYFIVPAKRNMDVFIDAKAIALDEKITGKEKIVVNREIEVSVGKGKNNRKEKRETVLVGISGLNTYDEYGPAGHCKNRYKKSFKPNRINGIVIKKWDGKDFEGKGGPVYITNLSINNPFRGFDYYDERSCIENSMFREGKQKWYLKRPGKRTEVGMTVHIFLTLFVLALTSAYWKWKEKKEGKKNELGIERWRAELQKENQEKVIVFFKKKYGIFYNYEVIILLGAKVKDFDEKTIFSKYNIRAL